MPGSGGGAWNHPRALRRRIWRFLRTRQFLLTFLPPLGFFTVKLLYRSLRITYRNRHYLDTCLKWGGPVIYTFWHGRMLMMPFVAPPRPLAILISPHRDGEYIGRILKRFGFTLIRGSARRGRAGAFKGMVKALNDGLHLAITPDGPRGPRGRVKRGILELARVTGSSILPVTFSSSSRLFLKTWDAFLIPLPFSRGIYIWGEPLQVNPGADKEEMAKLKQLLEDRLNTLTVEADTFFRS